MLYICTLLIGMLFLWLAGYVGNKKIRFVRSIILTVVFYFMLYILVSAVLFVFDVFMIKYAVLGTSTVCAMYFFINFGLLFRRKCDTNKEWVSERDSYVSFVIISFLLIITWGNFGFFGMGQDQGVYQTQAINFFYDKTETYQDIEEYNALEDAEYKEFYYEQIKALAGYDLLIISKDIPTVDVSNETGDLKGVWHGIPTYSAILGLSAKIFGLENMPFIGVLFYICLIGMMEFILSDLNLSCWVRRGAILLLGISPQVIWIKSSTLTESFLAVLIVTYIYYILHKDKEKRFWSVVPVITFGFFHVTIYTMMPMFILIYVHRFILEREKMYLTCIRIVSVAYLFGFLMMLKVQPGYTLRNYRNGLRFLSLEQIIVVACIGSCLGIIVSYIVKHIKIERSIVEKICKSVLRVIGVAVIVYLVFMAITRYSTWMQIRSMTVVCYSVLTGVFIIPYILNIFILKKYYYSIEMGIVGIMFFWCIVFYSIVMRREIAYYYYYSRYLMPYLSIVIILFAILMANRKTYYAFIIIGLLILTPYTMVVKNCQDDTYIQWDTFVSVLNEIDAGETVILDTDLMHIFYFPIRALGLKVYPIYDTLERTLDYIDTGEKVMYISRDKEENLNLGLSVRYRDYAEIKLDNNIDCRNIVLGLPQTGAVKMEIYPVTIYQCKEYSSNIFVYEDNYMYGWAPIDNSGYRWMYAKDAYLECFLKKEDYQMIIHTGCVIPFNSIQADKIAADVYLNEIFLGTIYWTEENADQDKVLDIPSEYITDGRNIVHFVSNLWSPAEYGSEDKSTYSFSVDSIELRKIVKEENDVHDLVLTWTFGNNKYLDGGLDNENERTLYPDGLSYGPYWHVPAGKWRITICGEGLEKTNVMVYSQYGKLYHKFEVEKSNNQISVLLFLPDASSDLEIVIRNTSDQIIQLTQMDLRREK